MVRACQSVMIEPRNSKDSLKKSNDSKDLVFAQMSSEEDSKNDAGSA